MEHIQVILIVLMENMEDIAILPILHMDHITTAYTEHILHTLMVLLELLADVPVELRIMLRLVYQDIQVVIQFNIILLIGGLILSIMPLDFHHGFGETQTVLDRLVVEAGAALLDQVLFISAV